jgi:hypothetical protein
MRARADLRYHKLFIRALVGGWNVPDDEKRRIIGNMLVIVTAPRVRKTKDQKNRRRLDPHPTERERIAAARVLIYAHASDTAIFRDCLDELHLRERLGLEPDPWATPTPTGQPVGPSATKTEPEAEFTTPTKVIDENGNVLSKELDLVTINELMIQRYGKPIADLLLNGPAEYHP